MAAFPFLVTAIAWRNRARVQARTADRQVRRMSHSIAGAGSPGPGRCVGRPVGQADESLEGRLGTRPPSGRRPGNTIGRA